MEGRVRTAVAATTSGDAADDGDDGDAGSEFQKACFGATLHHFWLYDLFKIRPLIGSLLGDPGCLLRDPGCLLGDPGSLLGDPGCLWKTLGSRMHGRNSLSGTKGSWNRDLGVIIPPSCMTLRRASF